MTPSSQSDSNPVIDADQPATTTADSSAATGSAAEKSVVDNPLESQTLSLRQSWLYAGGALWAVYGLFVSIDWLNIGFQSILGPEVEALLPLAANPWLGLLLGILATALIQSSSVVTTLLVGLVAGGLPLATAIPMVMGANLGTTITNTLVSLGYVGDDEGFERGFAAATIHDCFNLVALLIFFPLEVVLHPLEQLSRWLSDQLLGVDFMTMGITPMDGLLYPSRWLMAFGVNQISGPWDSLLLFSASVGGLMISVTTLSWLMKHWLNTPAKDAVHWVTGHGSGLGGLATGATITALAQSSSMTTSLMVPLASAGLVTLQDVYPFVLGANIGTCITALLATLALSNPVALQLALVHLGFNLLAVSLIYGLPPLRAVPLAIAQQLATAARQYRILAIAYVVGVFFLVPFLALWLSLTTFI